MTTLTLIAMPLLLASACTIAPGATETRDYCAGWREIVLSGADIDALSDEGVLAVDAHNRQGQDVGCWP